MYPTKKLPKNYERVKIWDIALELFAWWDLPKDWSYSKEKSSEYQIPIYANAVKDDGLYWYTSTARVIEPAITISARWTIGFTKLRNEPFYPIVRLLVLIPKRDKADLKFLEYVINTLNLKQFWSSIPQLSVPQLKNFEIPLPPLSTQSKIVAKLDEAFGNIDRQIGLLKANIKDVESMRKSVMEEIFQGGEYVVKSLWDIFDVRDGTHDSPKFHNTGYPLITSKNLTENGIDFGNIKFISQEDYDKINQRSKVDKWDLLFAMIGTIGSPTIVDIEPEFAIKNVALFKKKSETANMQFLKYFLSSQVVIEKMILEAKWATQKFVWLGYLRQFSIPLPPLPRQHEIVDHLDRVFAHTAELRSSYEAQIRDLEMLRQSLLEEAFAGRLVSE